MTHATPAIWGPNLQHTIYATPLTYRVAADWVRSCRTVADWGGGGGYLGTFLPPSVEYRVIDGTQQCLDGVVADLTTYLEPSDGIVLRHVLDNTPDWAMVLRNALQVCQQRLIVVTFTPAAATTRVVKMKSGWPIWQFNPADLRDIMGDWLVQDRPFPTTHPEHVYWLERPC